MGLVPRPRSIALLALGSALLALLPVSQAGQSSASYPQSAPRGQSPTAAPAAPPRAGPPNIVVITTDDQNRTDLNQMPRTRKYLGEAGTTFNGISPHPLCCPARAELITGQFAQNNGVRHNAGPLGGLKRLDRAETIGAWLNRRGYNTAYLGKYLNGYQGSTVDAGDPGWDQWDATYRGVYGYNRFTVNHNGELREFDETYQTDYFSRLARNRVRAFAKSPRPFLLWQSYVAPHGRCDPDAELRCWKPPIGADRHADLFPRARPPALNDPAYNERNMSDKPRELATRELFGTRRTRHMVSVHRQRLRALQAVDGGIASLVRTLHRTGELDNTLIIFTSDNGYMLGEHRHHGKVYAYEQSLGVPMIIRGPGVPRGKRVQELGTTVDVAPTIVAASGARATVPMDGIDLRPVARGREPARDTLLIQGGPRNDAEVARGWHYRGVRTQRYTYVEYRASGEFELYDRRVDPHQMNSVHNRPRYAPVRTELARRLRLLQGCSGDSCRRGFREVPNPL